MRRRITWLDRWFFLVAALGALGEFVRSIWRALRPRRRVAVVLEFRRRRTV